MGIPEADQDKRGLTEEGVIQEILEGKRAPEERDLVVIVRKGLPLGVIDIVARAFGMSPKELCKLLPVSWRTLQHYGADHLLDSHGPSCWIGDDFITSC